MKKSLISTRYEEGLSNPKEAYLDMNWIDPMDSFLIVSYHCDFYFEMG